MFWVVQSLGVIVCVLTLSMMFQKEKYKTMLFSALTNLVLVPTYILSGSLVAGLLVAGAFLRTVIYMIYNKLNRRADSLCLVFFGVYYLAISIIFWRSFVDVLMVANLVVVSFTTWQEGGRVMNIGFIVSSLLLCPFDILIGAYTSAVSEIIMLVGAIVFFCNYKDIKAKDVAQSYFSANKNFWDTNIENYQNFDLVYSNMDKSKYYNYAIVKNFENMDETFNEIKKVCKSKKLASVAYLPFDNKKYNTDLYIANALESDYKVEFEDVWLKLIDGFNLNNTRCKLPDVEFCETKDYSEVLDVYVKGYIGTNWDNITNEQKATIEIFKTQNFVDEKVKIDMFVARYRGEAVSLVVFLREKSRVFVTKVCTAVKYRRKHLASALIQHAIDVERKRGARTFVLVTDKNSVNEKFYHFNNFREFAMAFALNIERPLDV